MDGVHDFFIEMGGKHVHVYVQSIFFCRLCLRFKSPFFTQLYFFFASCFTVSLFAKWVRHTARALAKQRWAVLIVMIDLLALQSFSTRIPSFTVQLGHHLFHYCFDRHFTQGPGSDDYSITQVFGGYVHAGHCVPQ